MMLMIDGPMINKFIENSEEFDKFASASFILINEKKEGKISKSIAFEGEDGQENRYGVVKDLAGYKAELKEAMKAVARGIGTTPVSVLVEDGSFLVKVFEHEVAWIKKQKEDEEKAKEQEKEKEREISFAKKVEVMVPDKKIKKKNSFGFLSFCACSGKQFVANN